MIPPIFINFGVSDNNRQHIIFFDVVLYVCSLLGCLFSFNSEPVLYNRWNYTAFALLLVYSYYSRWIKNIHQGYFTTSLIVYLITTCVLKIVSIGGFLILWNKRLLHNDKFLINVLIFSIFSCYDLIILFILQLKELKRKYKQNCNKQIIELSDIEDINCSICLEEYTETNNITKTACGHIYHSVCINEWLERADTCPLCLRNLS